MPFLALLCAFTSMAQAQPEPGISYRPEYGTAQRPGLMAEKEMLIQGFNKDGVKIVTLPGDWRGALLTFEQIPTHAEVWVNGIRLKKHNGSWAPFYVNASNALARTPEGQTLGIKVLDSASGEPIDPSFLKHVYAREIGPSYIREVRVTPRANGLLTFDIETESPTTGLLLDIEVIDRDTRQVVASQRRSQVIFDKASISVRVPNPKLWTPNAPNLYDIRVSLQKGVYDNVTVIESIRSYTGFGLFSQQGDALNLNRQRFEPSQVSQGARLAFSLLSSKNPYPTWRDLYLMQNGLETHSSTDAATDDVVAALERIGIPYALDVPLTTDNANAYRVLGADFFKAYAIGPGRMYTRLDVPTPNDVPGVFDQTDRERVFRSVIQSFLPLMSEDELIALSGIETTGRRDGRDLFGVSPTRILSQPQRFAKVCSAELTFRTKSSERP